jgi:prepilin-type N-terminal cleavage/methylation domain-containing protein/prepilin-type processing-associated H-X9-DG protein
MNATHQPAKELFVEWPLVRRDPDGFTLSELLVVLAVLALLAATLLPALARTTPDSQAFQCRNNHRQLVLAWSMYAADNSDWLAVNADKSADYNGAHSWASGMLDWALQSSNTNTLYLIDDRVSSLGSYTDRQPLLYRCPADNYVTPSQRALGWEHRIRSVAMDSALGDGLATAGGAKCADFPWSTYWARKMSDLIAPGPSDSWVFTDENPDAIDDGILCANPAFASGTGEFTELPGCDHAGACGISYADGHAEIHRWLVSTTLHPVQYLGVAARAGKSTRVAVTGSQDLAYVASHTPRSP